MKLAATVTLFVSTVLFLANTAFGETTTTSIASSTPPAPQTATQTLTTKPERKADSFPKFGIIAILSRSTSLIDHQDGSRSDSMDYLLFPSAKFSFGTFSALIQYSQNLRDEYSETENDFGDIPVSFSFNPISLNSNRDYRTAFNYSVTALAPVSKLSTKKDQLQTSISGKAGLSLSPADEGFSASASISAGRYFHAYEEDINGSVLNQYSSNQQVKVGYGIGNWSLSAEYIHRSRWTYKGNIKGAFELTEEIEYGINKNYAVAIGHTNAGSPLRANGQDSNIEIFNENSSSVYASLSLSY